MIPDDTIIIEKIDEVFCRVRAPYDIFNRLRKTFRERPDGYQFMTAYKTGQWDGYIRFMKAHGKINDGLVPRIKKFVRESDYKLIDKRGKTKKDVNKKVFVKTLEYLNTDDFPPRKYQIRCSLKALRHRKGIILHGTGGGKTFEAGIMCNYLLRAEKVNRILYITPKAHLVNQGCQNFEDFGFPPRILGRYFGGAKDADKRVIFATWQTLQNFDRLPDGFLEETESVIIDETHRAQGKVLRKIIEKMKNAHFRIGFTGTLPDKERNPADHLTVKAVLGPVLDKKDVNELQDDGYLSDSVVNLVNMKYDINTDDEGKIGSFNQERKFLRENERRNEMIVNVVDTFTSIGQNVLVLVERVEEHGEVLQDLISDRIGREVPFINGDMPLDERKEIIDLFERSEGESAIATFQCFQEGIDISALHVVVLGVAGYSTIRNNQSFGRGLRKHETKDKLRVVDIKDNLHYSRKHANYRIQDFQDNGHSVEMFDESEFEQFLSEKRKES